MKVRMSYEVDVERIPHEMEKTRREIVALLKSAAADIECADITDVEKTQDSITSLRKGESSLAQARDKISSLSNYIDNHKQITERIKEEEIEQRAEEIAHEKISEMEEQLKQVINERTEEFNSIIKQREELIKNLQAELSESATLPPKKKAPRKKRSVKK
tara:strand:+ start:1950 stop:2429 length:480 start_codon:yes stop_codon:yes gene_type:complete